MKTFSRITLDPDVMGGRACVRGMRVTVGMVIGLLAAGRSREEILRAYPYLEGEDIDHALAYAAVMQVRTQDVLPSAIGSLVIAAIRQHEGDLLAGGLVVVDAAKSRVRVLPI